MSFLARYRAPAHAAKRSKVGDGTTAHAQESNDADDDDGDADRQNEDKKEEEKEGQHGEEKGEGATPAASSTSTAAADAVADKNDDMEENLLCSICRDVLHDAASALPCLHTFCGGCCSEWLQRNATCPQCRAPVTKLHRCLSVSVSVCMCLFVCASVCM